MNIELHPHFKKSYQKRRANNPKLVQRFRDRVEVFKQEPHNAILKDHDLIGTKAGLRAFSISGDVRVIYEKIEDRIIFHDIGTHNQVY